MNKITKTAKKFRNGALMVSSMAGAFLFGFPTPVAAAEGDSLLPAYIQEIIDAVLPNPETGPAPYIEARVRYGLTILFVVVFLVAIVFSAMAAIKFMSSQGDASKLEESREAVKAVLMGFAAMLLAIVGVLVVVWFFGGTSDIPTDLPTKPEASILGSSYG